MKLSVIIPSYKDPLLNNTMQSILDNFETDYEIIPIIDGYDPPELVKHNRIKPIILKDNVGMREAINIGVKASVGEYLMRADEHIMFCKGYDKIITDSIKDNQIMSGIRRFLDPVKWEIMEDMGQIVYEKLIIRQNPTKFTAVNWRSRERERKDIMVDETMAMQGSNWFMARSWWDKVIKRLDSEGYGTLYQDSTEMQFKTWNAGGQLMVNKNAWYAHKHRSFNRTHNYPGELSRKSWAYSLKMWEKDYEVFRKKWKI